MIFNFHRSNSFSIWKLQTSERRPNLQRIFVPTKLRMIPWGGLQKIQEVKAEASSEKLTRSLPAAHLVKVCYEMIFFMGFFVGMLTENKRFGQNAGRWK